MFSISNYNQPQILTIEKDFLLVYKPPRMHSAPERNSSGGETILDWCVKLCPEVARLSGRKAGEGGLLHRLDYETQGLMLIARSELGMKALLEQQWQGKIFKEYSAMAMKCEIQLPGFPPMLYTINPQVLIQSAFRAYGSGRKAVRPVLFEKDKIHSKIYSTEILKTISLSEEGYISFYIRILKGFRHQIRSHLAWLGFPILNDKLYGGAAFEDGILALRASALSFTDPSSGEERTYSIPVCSFPDFGNQVK